MDRWRGRSTAARVGILGVAASFLTALAVVPSVTTSAQAATACPADGCAVTVDAHDFASGAALTNFNYIVNEDNTKLPNDPLALNTESYTPILATGDQDRNTVNLPAGRYLISVRSLDHKMWGSYITLPDDAADDGSLTARVDLTEVSGDHPLPLGKLRVFVFEDNSWTNGAPDAEEATATGGLGGFQVGLEEQTGNAVTVDYNNDPLCGGICKTATDGFVEINNLGPATYFADVHPPEHCNPDPNAPNRLTTGPGTWAQTTTIDGGLSLMTPVEEGSDGTGAPGEQLWEPPNRRTAYWFGFVCTPMDFANPGTGEITGQARNWVEWAPYTTGTYDTPVDNPFIALTDAATDTTVFQGRGDENGNFDIQGVPAGTYNMSIWDEQLNYIMRFKPITVAAGETVDANDVADNGESGVGVSRWFGWLEGTVYKDQNGNGQFDADVDTPIANTDMDQRWRDGSIKEDTFTDASGHYMYPTAEGGALGRWFINEQGFARFSSYPGASAHDELTGDVTPSCVVEPPDAPANPCVPNSQGGGLLMNQTTLEGHRAVVDWGKRDYPSGTPGQIVGITYFATTRNEFDARFQAHENYEPAIPDAIVYLETPGPDGVADTDDDVVVNKYVTDHWQQPSADQDPQDNGQGGANSFTQNCNPIRDYNGTDITDQFSPKIGPNCLEVPLTGNQTKEGAFDGGYAFADYCPGGYDLAADDGTCVGGTDPEPLVAGTYITHSIMPKDDADTRDCNPTNPDGFKNVSDAHGAVPGGGQGCLFRIVREEDVNVDLGNQFAPQIPPPPCAGDMHVLDQSSLVTRSVYYTGDQATSPSQPLCDKRLVELQNGQNANADFFLMTNFRTDPNGADDTDTRTGDVAEPGRLVGQVFNDIYFERNPESPWYGEPRPISGIPVGIYARVDTVCPDGGTTSCDTPNINTPFDPSRWRLLKTVTTSADGSFEAIVPSTETFNCPIPQGPCPGMYLITVDDPGTKANPNPTFDPNLLIATTPAEAWPGLTTQLDLPVDPISGTGCDFSLIDGTATTVPELLQVSRPYVLASNTGTARRITITGDFIGPAGPTGATGGHVNLTDDRTGDVTTLTRANGGVVSWTPGSGSTPDTIVIQIPAINTTTFRPGPKQLTIVGATSNGGQSSVNGITVHVLGSNGTGTGLVTYNPPIVNVPAPPPAAGGDPHALQNAIDGAAAGSLVVLSPGVYNENILLWKRLRIQGVGPGGLIGSHELNARAPEDPRFHIVGSLIDGRFFPQNAADYDATVSDHGPYATDPTFSTIMRGADITAVAQSASAYDVPTLPSGQDSPAFNGARIDGIGLQTGRGDGAGGVQLQANINNMQVTNNIVENNGGIFAGGVGLGQPYAHGNHNFNVRMGNDRILGNGGLTRSGGIGIFYGSNNYDVTGSIFCSNFGVEYGAGISHWGLSPGGSIHDNKIYYNDAVDSGAGIAVQTELPVGSDCTSPGATLATCRGAGSGAVNIDRNLIQGNFSGDDGGGIFVADAFTQPVNIRNNMVVDNGAADLGGAITLDDSSNVRIINNSVANNVTTASSENSCITPTPPATTCGHSAGLGSEANEPLFQATLPAGSPDFSNPTALFNNIFWDNDAMTLSQFGPGATLVDAGFIDFEVRGTTNNADTFTPRYSTLTNGQILGPDGVLRALPGGQGNRIGEDPLFVTPFTLELTVSGSRLDPQAAAVNITGQDPPVGLGGDYHLLTTSPAVDRGVRCSGTPFPAPLNATAPCTTTNRGIGAPAGLPSATNATGGGDYDSQYRPQLRTIRIRTPWDLGADELPGIPVVLVPPLQ